MDNPCRLPLKPRLFASVLESLLGLNSLAKIWDDIPRGLNPYNFLDQSLTALGIKTLIENRENTEEIPRTGPLLIVANHPLGGLEGMALAKVLLEVRPDLLVLTNEILRRIPELAPLFVGVDVLSNNAAAGNVAGIKQVHKHIANGGAVLIFPAGMVSAYESSHRRIQDREWNRLSGHLIKKYEASCVPVHVKGKNSLYFYGAGLIHPRLRTLLLPRQLANKQGFNLALKFGRPIPPKELRTITSPIAVTQYLRLSTDALGLARQTQPRPTLLQEIDIPAPETTSDDLDQIIYSLEEFRLIEHEELDVYCAPYDRLGKLVELIAIARETTFRAVSEGTGLAKDSDEFDPHYLHLFLWDKSMKRIAGAYRVGLVDEIVAEHGVQGLYSRSLYKYDDAFITRLGPAIELGRSFVHIDYQRHPVSLSLLWQGIGALLVQRPKYRMLFGSVSISREYSDLARSLIADVLLTNFKAEEFDSLVEPIVPHEAQTPAGTEVLLAELNNVKTLSKLVGRCDPGKKLPVLLRHYLSLNARLVCFNIHQNFNDSLEGLIIVDVDKTERKSLKRFLGKKGLKHYFSAAEAEGSAES